MRLWEYSFKNVRVKLHDGSVFEGEVNDYTSAVDNEPDPESITVKTEYGVYIELFAPEIASVEII